MNHRFHAGRSRTRRQVIVAACALLAALAMPHPAGALDFSASLGTWRFASSNATFAYLGAGVGAPGRFEAGAGLVPRLIDDPLSGKVSELYAEAHLGIALYGDRARPDGIVSTYASILTEIGYLVGSAGGAFTGKAFTEGTIFLRLTPLALGNPYYGRRDRIATTALLYDLGSDSWGIAFTIFQSDFFLARRGKFR